MLFVVSILGMLLSEPWGANIVADLLSIKVSLFGSVYMYISTIQSLPMLNSNKSLLVQMEALTYSKDTKPSHVAIAVNVFCLYFIKMPSLA